MSLDRRALLRGGVAAAALTTMPWTAARAAESLAKYKGQQVRFLSSRNVHQTALGDTMAALAKAAGIDFQPRYITTDQLQKKVVIDFTGGSDTWDIVYTGGIQRMYEWFDGGIVKDMAPLIKSVGDDKILEWDKFTPSAQSAVKFKDHILGLTVATSDQAMGYRKDIFENAEEKTAFKAKYGYDLKAPETYAQFRDSAEFFTRKKGAKLAGKTLERDFYGAIMSNKAGTFLWHKMENVMMAFGVDLYDPATGNPAVNSEPAIKAAGFYASMLPFFPPGHINLVSGEAAAQYATGDGALIIEYFDRLMNAVEKNDGRVPRDAFAYAFPPSVPGAPHNRKHPFRSGPAVVSLFGRSRNPEAAYKLLEAAASTEQQSAMAKAYPGYLPSKEPALEELITREPVVGYLRDVAAQNVAAMTDVDIMPYPSILVASKIGDTMSDAITAVLLGEKPESALGKAQTILTEAYAGVRNKK